MEQRRRPKCSPQPGHGGRVCGLSVTCSCRAPFSAWSIGPRRAMQPLMFAHGSMKKASWERAWMENNLKSSQAHCSAILQEMLYAHTALVWCGFLTRTPCPVSVRRICKLLGGGPFCASSSHPTSRKRSRSPAHSIPLALRGLYLSL